MELLDQQGHAWRSFDLVDGLDIRNYEQVRTSIEAFNPTQVHHLAAQAFVPESTSDIRRGVDVNIGGTLNILEALRHTGSQAKVHIASTSEAVGYTCDLHDENTVPGPTTPYGVTKLAAEHLGLTYSRLYGLNVVVTRAFNHTGPRHPAVYAVPSFAKRVADVEAGRAEKVVHGNLDAVRSYTDVRDMVRAYRLAIDLPTGVYNVGSEMVMSMQQVLDTLCSLAKAPIETELAESLYRPANPHFPVVRCDKFREATGWKPEIPWEKTLLDTLNWFREQ